MKETFFARITDVLPSRVVVLIPSDRGESPIVRSFDYSPLVNVIDLRPGVVFKITIETNPGEVNMKYEPADKSDYHE